ncbi:MULTISPECIES: 5-formyltetrahydrofolate cyclo-ligase [unclassified Mesorhizobium]|uniref:5-formyltetrahydrofolate cyclo-ligase n=1 Tax=unclassified Mesorhizobium TaxID=325217 RepID=UPI000FDAAF0E|nr:MULTISPECIES: 5-formyltetrahydrofolate cyclo-ligase [unclassified Mesorhizobium]TGT71957.1 5-formyltetrahydrofolate cyclo-ligase [Mesorhizobium sp. M2E.F.Ca.ET.166.01.1.1]TGV99328.1 5-formyltetrahydrofolate cyclo-ligase [Mesorhizobium sp. M2E.F.Ca.ET.154.01.1.1]
MADNRDPDLEIPEYASPPCYAHELSPEYGGQSEPEDSWSCVLRWRKVERQRLIEERLAIDADERKKRSDRIASRLDLAIGKVNGRIVSGYWPFRGEPDLRNWAITVIERGGRIALPVVIRKGWPLEFRIWSPGDPLERGVWNILVPSRGPSVLPDVVIAPVVGFDGANYRLGYGGGFFDRTLAAMHRRPLAIGVGYAGSRLETIRPQPHDIAMDAIVTD